MGGGTSNSIIATLNKCNDYIIKTIGHEDSGLTTNDVDYLYNSTNNNLSDIIENILTNNINNTNNVIILLYPGIYTSTQTNINPQSSTKIFTLIGIGNKKRYNY